MRDRYALRGSVMLSGGGNTQLRSQAEQTVACQPHVLCVCVYAVCDRTFLSFTGNLAGDSQATSGKLEPSLLAPHAPTKTFCFFKTKIVHLHCGEWQATLLPCGPWPQIFCHNVSWRDHSRSHLCFFKSVSRDHCPGQPGVFQPVSTCVHSQATSVALFSANTFCDPDALGWAVGFSFSHMSPPLSRNLLLKLRVRSHLLQLYGHPSEGVSAKFQAKPQRMLMCSQVTLSG